MEVRNIEERTGKEDVPRPMGWGDASDIPLTTNPD